MFTVRLLGQAQHISWFTWWMHPRDKKWLKIKCHTLRIYVNHLYFAIWPWGRPLQHGQSYTIRFTGNTNRLVETYTVGSVYLFIHYTKGRVLRLLDIMTSCLNSRQLPTDSDTVTVFRTIYQENNIELIFGNHLFRIIRMFDSLFNGYCMTIS